MCGSHYRLTSPGGRGVWVVMLTFSILAPVRSSAQEVTSPPLVDGPGRYNLGQHRFHCAVRTEPDDPPMLGVGRPPVEGERGRLIDVGVSIAHISGEQRRTLVLTEDTEQEVCLANLFEPGIYEVRNETLTDSWIWVVNPDASSATVTRVIRVSLGLKLFRSIYQIQVGEPPVAVEPEPECEARPTLQIVYPRADTFVAFDTAQPGRLEIQLSATVSGEACDGAEVVWSAEAIPGSAQSFLAADGSLTNVGDDVTLIFEGLPDHTREFGPKTIRASIGNFSKTVAVDVFFEPNATNHGGAGNGQTPNWYHYWLETSAGQGKDQSQVEYQKPCSDPEIVSHYDGFKNDLAMDKFFMCDDGSWPIHSTIPDQWTDGIDTFAIIVMHEWEHKNMFDEWWREIYTRMYRDPELWNKAEGKWTDADLFLPVVEPHDGDVDGVLDSAEPHLAASRGGPLDPLDWDTNDYGTSDTEYLAFVAQLRWSIGSANGEDWSKCGKIWRSKYAEDCPRVGPYIER